jgi:lipid-binding SYLF domain-containing protein
LAGASVRPDNAANARIYGKQIDAEDIIFGNTVKVPTAAQRMISYLTRRSPKNASDPRSLREDKK